MMFRWMSLVPEKMTPPTLSRRSRSRPVSVSVAEGAEGPDGVEAVLDEGLGDVELGHRGLEGGVLAAGLLGGVGVDEVAAGLEADLHVDDPVRDRLELADRLAELGPLAGVGDAAIELPSHRAEGPGEDRAALPFEGGVEDRGAAAGAVEEGVGGEPAVLEGEFGHRGGPHPELLQLADDPEAGGLGAG